MAKCKISALNGTLKGQTVFLEKYEITIGREGDNDIVISNDRNVSRHHCRIFELNKAIWIEDLNSSNGTIILKPGLSSMQLVPQQPTIVFENSIFTLGSNQFQISELAQYQHDALGTIGFQFQEVLADINELQPDWSEEKKSAYQAALLELEDHIKNASSERELLGIIASDIQKLTSVFLQSDNLEQTIVFDPALVLPDLPESLSEPLEDAWVDSIRNIFITDIKRCLPEDKDEE